ncbi:MAG: SEC-C metal-binding domain-containing protein [Bacteriovorax sp.]|nr:SEC-C metal-binding domain-containing protein [Bacteriovorax sp.]
MSSHKENTTSVEVETVKTEKGEQHEHIHGPSCSHGHQHTLLRPITREAPKVGRNDPCPCGSQKKFKKCCGI